MPKYRIRLVSETTKVAYVEVEAENADEAEDEAYGYEDANLEWNTHTAYYADEVEKLEEERNQ